MENDKYRLILEGIKQKLETGQLKAKKISANGIGEEYEVVISAYRFAIAGDDSSFWIKLKSEYGDLIDSANIRNQSFSLWKYTDEAFRAMRSQAMNAEKAIDTLLTTLENLK